MKSAANATLCLALLSAVALADGVHASPVVNLQRATLLGAEYDAPRLSESMTLGGVQCTYAGGGVMHLDGVSHRDWVEDYADCGGRTVVLLSRKVGAGNGTPSLRVVDALLLPPLAPDRSAQMRRPVLYRSTEGQCDLLGREDTAFIALLRWNGRDKIDWRSGVDKAWTFDLAQGRIVPLSTKRIRCEYTPP